MTFDPCFILSSEMTALTVVSLSLTNKLTLGSQKIKTSAALVLFIYLRGPGLSLDVPRYSVGVPLVRP